MPAKTILIDAQKRQTIHAAKYELVKRQARAGDPLPYIAFQWPGTVLDDFQVDVLKSLFDPTVRTVYQKGNTGCGKGASAAIGICVYFDVWHDAKIIVTSSTFDHAVAVLFAETAVWYKSMRLRPPEELWTTGIGDPQLEHYVEVVNPGNDESFSGRHGEHVLFVFDEATAIADSRFKLARTQMTKFLAQANPRTMFGAFKQGFPRDKPNVDQTFMAGDGKRRCITIDGDQCLNVREKRLKAPIAPRGGIDIKGRQFAHGETIPPELYADIKPLIPGQICYDEYVALCADTDARWVKVFAHGQFPDEDPDTQIILGDWIDRANGFWNRFWPIYQRVKSEGRLLAMRLLRSWFPIEGFGLDVAASEGGDETQLSVGGRRGILQLHKCQFRDTMDVVGWVIKTVLDEYGIDLTQGQHPVAIDMDGLGKGVGDRLAELNVRVIEMHGNDTADDPKLYANKRAERYATLGQRLDPRGKHADDVFMLPVDSFLAEELCAHEKVFAGSEGLRFAITPKRKPPGSNYDGPTVQGKIGRSPDRSDSVSYCYEAIRSCQGGNLAEWLAAGAF